MKTVGIKLYKYSELDKESQGTGGLYELAEELTFKFEKLHQGKEWDGEYFDEIDNFLENELKSD